ncbi:MAG: hypothetical protein AB7O04_13490, partial [Hyphomonadaceae bacterium]
TVAAEDVIYHIDQTTYDLYIGLRDLTDPDLAANQVTDYVKVVDGAIKWIGTNSQIAHWNTIQFIKVGGIEIDLLKLNLNWIPIEYWDGGSYYGPVVLDLGGDGADLISVRDSQVVVNGGEGQTLYRVGWVGGQDGMLAIDRDGDGAITKISEISFLNEKEGATTDMEGLAGLDSNQDGLINAQDARWGELKLWRDVNENGRGYGKEVVGLTEAGITGISLALTPMGGKAVGADNAVINKATFLWADGRSGTAYDVALANQVAHLSRKASTDDPFTSPPADGELGRAIASDGLSDGRVAWDAGPAPAQDMVFVRADARDGVDDLPEIVPNLENLSILGELIEELDGEAPSDSAGGVAPIVIDLDNNGISLIDPMSSPVQYDVDRDGLRDRIGWVGAGDALLALDRDGDGQVSLLSEISFVGDAEGAQSDLEGLRAYDSNQDGALDAADARFGDFMLWRDLNQDGRSSIGEVQTLTQSGLQSLALVGGARAPIPLSPTANLVLQTVSAQFVDGSVRMAGDVVLGSRSGLALAMADPEPYVGLEDDGVDYSVHSFGGSWALGPNVRRIAMGETDDAQVLQPIKTRDPLSFAADKKAALPFWRNATDHASKTDAPGAFGKHGARNEGQSSAASPTTPLELQAVASGDEAKSPEGSAVRRWWAERRPQESVQASPKLSELMTRMAPQSLAERLSAATLRSDRALPADGQGKRIDQFVQAVAGQRGRAGGEARTRAEAEGLSENATLPTAWKKARLRA